jgi:hypothetical protein
LNWSFFENLETGEGISNDGLIFTHPETLVLQVSNITPPDNFVNSAFSGEEFQI